MDRSIALGNLAMEVQDDYLMDKQRYKNPETLAMIRELNQYKVSFVKGIHSHSYCESAESIDWFVNHVKGWYNSDKSVYKSLRRDVERAENIREGNGVITISRTKIDENGKPYFESKIMECVASRKDRVTLTSPLTVLYEVLPKYDEGVRYFESRPSLLFNVGDYHEMYSKATKVLGKEKLSATDVVEMFGKLSGKIRTKRITSLLDSLLAFGVSTDMHTILSALDRTLNDKKYVDKWYPMPIKKV
jgi:hypothetical protein